jgi:hypothetical protein
MSRLYSSSRTRFRSGLRVRGIFLLACFGDPVSVGRRGSSEIGCPRSSSAPESARPRDRHAIPLGDPTRSGEFLPPSLFGKDRCVRVNMTAQLKHHRDGARGPHGLKHWFEIDLRSSPQRSSLSCMCGTAISCDILSPACRRSVFSIDSSS